MSTKLEKVAERAQDATLCFHSLAHLIDQDALKRAYGRIRKGAAVGVDGITKEEYGERLEENLRDLHGRMRAGKYRHQPIRRVHIPKDRDRTRPIGISTVEDKLVQRALTEVMEVVYEPLFHDGSYGFRPGRGAHDAIRVVNRMCLYEGVGWILEADIESFFDSVDRTRLKEMIRQRISDRSIHRLVGKCLRVGVLDGEEFATPSRGTAQGSVISPLLGNIYLHHALDMWFEDEVRVQLRGQARLIRYADDFVIGFTRKDDAEETLRRLRSRLSEYGLKLHPDKTRLVPFRRPPRGQRGGKGPGTWDFLGFTVYWRESHKGGWFPGTKTRKASHQKAVQAISEYCRSHRHKPLAVQHAALTKRLVGHYNYFGVNGNYASLWSIRQRVERTWLKWLRRRSQRATRLSWERFKSYLRRFPLPRPRIAVQVWGAP